MAIKLSNGKFVGGVKYLPGQPPEYGEELKDVRPSSVLFDCHECGPDVATVVSHEYLCGHTVQWLCFECGWGLTPAEPIDELLRHHDLADEVRHELLDSLRRD
jgi:hypothetical protein